MELPFDFIYALLVGAVRQSILLSLLLLRSRRRSLSRKLLPSLKNIRQLLKEMNRQEWMYGAAAEKKMPRKQTKFIQLTDWENAWKKKKRTVEKKWKICKYVWMKGKSSSSTIFPWQKVLLSCSSLSLIVFVSHFSFCAIFWFKFLFLRKIFFLLHGKKCSGSSLRNIKNKHWHEGGRGRGGGWWNGIETK